MILRIWNAWTDAARAESYLDLFRTSIGPHLAEIPGFRRAEVATRSEGESVAISTFVLFDSIEAIEAFAGADLEKANVSKAAQVLLHRFDERVTHLEIRSSSEDATM